MTPVSEVYNEDCLPAMTIYPDKYFSLGMVDPPYGINAPNMAMGSHPNKTGIGTGGGISTAQKLKKGKLNAGSGVLKNRNIQKMGINWDYQQPPTAYFIELFRICKHVIIWGGNYFPLPPTRGIVCWNKNQPWDNFSQFEMAWTNFDMPAKLFTLSNRGGANTEKKIHPTQKPVLLYKWLLTHYAQPGNHILDTHMGSQSSRIAAWDMGFDFTGFELDTEYFEAGNKRFDLHIQQQSLFK